MRYDNNRVRLQLEGLPRIINDIPEGSKTGFDIYVDGGVRSGLDVFKALAIGAKFVFIGRPAAWGLFHSVRSMRT